ncbi:hypothetical protein HCN44_000184 [Aphidius gifuensis]|uniref:tRNA-specific adenosine deaminase 1 n=1 Tax=Aphidius gifuensis TaxID=684658 RepID=A0A835CP98_APHGI|nr:tRNA-specific adenosine deaminase 1 [Aphidius gifuensis]KAF7990379.1 hypothetical protein HCN44_000184 [Aphidius gifuensis]
MNNFEDTIAQLCLNKYHSLKKTGKPIATEWTVLSGIVMKNNDNNLKVIALATGTKCLGINELIDNKINIGNRLHDSHAEVLTRRAFLRYLYIEIEKLLNNENNLSDIFILNTYKNIIELKNGVSFHFYCSQTPCGDCSIIPINYTNLLNDEVDIDVNGREIGYQETEIIQDLHRTGAKCIVDDKIQDPKLPGVNYHAIGPLRTKPGRGDPTLSLSCSDKLAKWNIVGIQGALLSILIPKIKLETIVIGGNCPFSIESMNRGIFKRFSTEISAPIILQSTLEFEHIKSDERHHPCPSSVIWCHVKNRHTEVAVEGRKQGATKKNKCNLLITRKELLHQFLKIIDNSNLKIIDIPKHPKILTYYDYKQLSIDYQKTWKECKQRYFENWPSKPIDLQQFLL